MNVIPAAFLISLAQASKILTGLVLIKVIAVYLGPKGLGQLGHLFSVVAILNLLAGGGIVNGVIKYVSEYRTKPKQLLEFISAAASYSTFVSVLIFVGVIIFSKPLSRLIFNSSDYQWYFVFLAIVQVCFAFTKLVTGVANGLKSTQVFAWIQLGGNIITIPVIWYLVAYHGLKGSVISVALVFALLALPALYAFFKSSFWGRVKISFNQKKYFSKLSGFSLMLLASAMTFPVVEVIIRQMIIDGSGYNDAGVWQATIKLSAAYVGFFGLFLAYYFLPQISPEENKQIIGSVTKRYILFIAVIYVCGALVFWFGRAFFIPLVLSDEFESLNQIIHLQLIGDFLKILSYVIGFVFVAKAFTWLYIGAEVLQNTLLLSLSYWFYHIDAVLESIFIAYIVTYGIYLCVAILAMTIFLRPSPNKSI